MATADVKTGKTSSKEQRLLEHVPLSSLPHNVRTEIDKLLNPLSPIGMDWRDVAEKLGFCYQDIKYIMSLQKPDGSNCQRMLAELEGCEQGTVGHLIDALEKCGRKDVIHVLLQHGTEILQSYEAYKRGRGRSRPVSEEPFQNQGFYPCPMCRRPSEPHPMDQRKLDRQPLDAESNRRLLEDTKPILSTNSAVNSQASITATQKNMKEVFITFANDASYKSLTYQLHQNLYQNNRIAVYIDEKDCNCQLTPKMLKRFKRSDFVLICISPKYNVEVCENQPYGRTTTTARLHTGHIMKLMQEEYESNGNCKKRFIPVLLKDSSFKHMPEWLYHVTGEFCYRLPNDYNRLLFHILRAEDTIQFYHMNNNTTHSSFQAQLRTQKCQCGSVSQYKSH